MSGSGIFESDSVATYPLHLSDCNYIYVKNSSEQAKALSVDDKDKASHGIPRNDVNFF